MNFEVGEIIFAPYKKFTWLDRVLWRVFRYELKRKSEMRRYVITHFCDAATVRAWTVAPSEIKQ